MVRKILWSLSKACRPKILAIQEARDLNVLSLDALVGPLKTHEIELNEASEENNIKGKSMALKFTQRRPSSSKAIKTSKETNKEKEPSDDEDEEDKDEIAHLLEKISRAWIKRMKKKKALFLKRTRKEKPSKMRSTAVSARSLDIYDLNIQN